MRARACISLYSRGRTVTHCSFGDKSRIEIDDISISSALETHGKMFFDIHIIFNFIKIKICEIVGI